jgi:hypothetical protein
MTPLENNNLILLQELEDGRSELKQVLDKL